MYKISDQSKSHIVNVFFVKIKYVQSGFLSKTRLNAKFHSLHILYGNNKSKLVVHQFKLMVFINTSWYKNKLRYSSKNVKRLCYVMQFVHYAI